jgi:hypothetical protein
LETLFEASLKDPAVMTVTWELVPGREPGKRPRTPSFWKQRRRLGEERSTPFP